MFSQRLHNLLQLCYIIKQIRFYIGLEFRELSCPPHRMSCFGEERVHSSNDEPESVWTSTDILLRESRSGQQKRPNYRRLSELARQTRKIISYHAVQFLGSCQVISSLLLCLPNKEMTCDEPAQNTMYKYVRVRSQQAGKIFKVVRAVELGTRENQTIFSQLLSPIVLKLDCQCWCCPVSLTVFHPMLGRDRVRKPERVCFISFRSERVP
jgi:hypothetical protein